MSCVYIIWPRSKPRSFDTSMPRSKPRSFDTSVPIPLSQYLYANTSVTMSEPIPLSHNQYKNISPINIMTFFELLNDFILSMTMPGAKDGEEQ